MNQMKGITDMKLENYEVHLPSYSIGSTIYNEIGPVCSFLGDVPFVTKSVPCIIKS